MNTLLTLINKHLATNKKQPHFTTGQLLAKLLYTCCLLLPSLVSAHPGHIVHSTVKNSDIKNQSANNRDIEYSNEKFHALSISNDQAKAELNNHLANKIHWDDIEQWEFFEGEVTSTSINHAHWDAVRLAAGASVVYRIPRRVFTRIFSEQESFANNLSFLYGDGSGLFLEQKDFQALANNLLFMPRNDFWQLMIHNCSDTTATVSVLTSRASGEKAFPQALTLVTPQPQNQPQPHSDDHSGSHNDFHINSKTNTEIRIETPHISQRDDFVLNQHKTHYTVEGPAFIEVESLLLQVKPTEELPSYAINAELDGKPWLFWQHQAALYPFLRRVSGENLTRSTYIEKYYLQIPKGEHSLSLSTLRPVALRIFENPAWALASNEDFLYPNLAHQQQQQIDYQLGLNHLTAALLTRSDKAKNNIINHWLNTHHPIDINKERAIKRSQFYRSVVASTSKPPLRTVNLTPTVSRYSSLQGHPDLLDLTDQEEVDKDLAETEPADKKSTFIELPAKGSLTFSIPRRSGDSVLRIRLASLNKELDKELDEELDKQEQKQKFLLTDQQGNQSTLFYYPEFKSQLLASHQSHLQDGFTPVAEMKIPLLHTTKSITIKALSSAKNNHFFQLSYLTERNRTLATAELKQGLIKLHQNDPRVIIQYLQGELPTEAADTRHQLELLLSELALTISIRAQQFEQDIPSINSQLEAGINVPNNWQQQVQILRNKKDFAGAIDITAPLTRHNNQQLRTQAAKLQAQLLWNADAFFLYEQWLLKLLTAKEHTRLHNFAEKALLEYYHQQDKMGSLEKLAAYRFIRSGSLKYLQQLESSLDHQSALPLKQQLLTVYNVLKHSTEKHISGEPLWQSVKANEVSARSARLLWGHALNNYSSRYIISPSQGLELTIKGPAILAIGHRSLLSGGSEQSQDDWLIVHDQLIENHSLNAKHNTPQTHYFPTFQTALSNDVSLVGSYTRVSAEQAIQYAISAGTHTITIQPKYSGAVIGLSKLALKPTATASTASTNQYALSIGLTQVDINNTTDESLSAFKKQRLSIEKTLLRLIWQIEHNKLFTVNKSQHENTLLALIAQGNQLAQNTAPSSPSNLLNKKFNQRLLQRLNQYVQWQLEQQLVDSAGRRIVEFKTTPTSNPKAKIRQALKGQKTTSAIKLSAINDLNFALDINQTSELKLQLKQLAPLNAFSKPASIQVWLNNQLLRKIWLKPNNEFSNIKMVLNAGSHQVRIALIDAKSDQQVLFKAQKKISNQWADIEIPVKQTFYVSSKTHPVKVFAAASQWLRIDDYKNGKVYRSHLFQGKNGVITLHPAAGKAERLVRVYKQRLKSDLNDLPASTALRSFPAEAQYEYTAKPNLWQFNDTLELGEENEGTWGGYLTFANRASLDDEEPDLSSSMNSLQLGHLYQKRLSDNNFWTSPSADWSNNTYWKSDTFVRQTSDSGNTLGTEQKLHIAAPLTDWQFSMRAKAQLFQATNDFSDDVLNLYADAQYRHDWQFNRQQSLNASLTGFARYFDDESPAGSRDIDPLVYSTYKRDHSYGLKLAGNWRYKLWPDSRFEVGSQLITNESILSADQVSLKAGYSQYFKGLTAGVSFRRIQRFSDDNRSANSQQNEIKGSLRYHHWNAAGNEWYLGLNALYDLTHTDSALALTFGFNHSDGRGTRDFIPTALPMRDLYQQQSTQQQSINTLLDQSSL